MDSDLKNQQSKEVEGKEMDKISVAGDTTKHEFATKECPVKNVTIFVDRAEVSRTIELDVVEGNSEALLKDLPASADQDSVRVSCYGEATIVEVSYQEKAVNEIDLDDDTERKTKTETEIQDIKNSLKSLNIDKTKLNQRADLIKNQKSLLQKYADCISNTKEDKVADLMEQSKVENMLHFLSVYEEKNTNLENELFEIEKSTGKINSEILVLEKNLKKLKHDDKAMKIERNVSILLEAKVSGKIILVASYVVHEASWKPLYDVRAFNKDNTVQILYFGMIKQNTGEDWENAKLSLSTALPSVGGSPPSLSPQTISIAPTRPVYKSRAKGFGGIKRSKSSRARSYNRDEYDPTIDDESIGFNYNTYIYPSSLPEAKVL